MKNKISLHRMCLLAKSIFCQNWSRDWKIFLVIIILHAFHFALNGVVGVYYPLSLAVIMVLLYLAGTTYRLLEDTKHAMFYMALPVSTAEKFWVNLFFVHIYYLVAFVLVSVLGFYIGVLLNNIFEIRMMDWTTDLTIHWGSFARSVCILVAGQAALMFGSVFFKRHAFIKSLLCMGLLFLDLALIFLFIPELFGFYADVTEWYSLMCAGLIALYFWILTYLRLKETEV
ncbi:MAG: hypothetical protein IJT04_06330 [Bacteroidales bacterium]|nr:hypothetical protein [Bacteroidales bacterium]